MKKNVFCYLLITIASLVGYVVATRAMEDSRDFR